MKKVLHSFNNFNKVNENDTPFRLYGDGSNSESELISLLKSLIDDINKYNPIDQEDFNKIKDEISNKKEEIISHPKFNEFKDGFEWQDSTIKLSDWKQELETAVDSMYSKAVKRGLH